MWRRLHDNKGMAPVPPGGRSNERGAGKQADRERDRDTRRGTQQHVKVNGSEGQDGGDEVEAGGVFAWCGRELRSIPRWLHFVWR
eukprot:m.45761 g.45761  ORF g.45761 m.45761 type:complete len:85 (-) comp12201_c0_seq1:161-415(-)